MADLELRGFKGLRNLNDLAQQTEVRSSTCLEKLEQISIDKIKPGKYQPRKLIKDTALEELACSIKEQGIIQPLIIRRVDTGGYEIIAGERRWQAAKIAGLGHVPVIVREIEDNVALAFALIENIQRESLNAIEEAEAFTRLKDEFEMTHSEVAKIVGKSRASVTNAMRLLSLDEVVKDLLRAGQLNMGHARALLALTAGQQLALANKIVEKRLSVREAENLSQSMKLAELTEIEKTKSNSGSFYQEKCKKWGRALSGKISTKVTVKMNAKGVGRVVIHIDSPSQIEELIKNL